MTSASPARARGVLGSASGADAPAPAVAIWLAAVAAIVFAMVVVGGATRLTGSGLSITEWKPILGAAPPLSAEDWREAFDKYRQIPQYRLVNRGMSLDGFKAIFWWEWSHRLLGRALGAAFAIPLLAFVATGRLKGRLALRAAGLLALGALQGFVGWWMVESGLETRVAVAPERLAIHLGLALALYVAIIWTAWDAGAGPRRGRAGPLAGWTGLTAGLVYLQCLLGALVAGNKAGLVDTDWPRMRGRWFPEDYWAGDLLRTALHNAASVQLHHRLLAYLVVVLACGVGVAAARRSAPRARGFALATAMLALSQAALGVATLVNAVPVGLGVAHQALAALLLAVATSSAWLHRHTGAGYPVT